MKQITKLWPVINCDMTFISAAEQDSMLVLSESIEQLNKYASVTKKRESLQRMCNHHSFLQLPQ